MQDHFPVQDDLEEYQDPESYDLENPWAEDDDFYLALAAEIDASELGGPVLDIACGTGRLTRVIAETGLEVVGLDLALPMLRQARRLDASRSVAWLCGDCRFFSLARRFPLILMTAHAYQGLLCEEDQRAFLLQVHEHLAPEGIFAFDTRNYPLSPAPWGKDRFIKAYRDQAGETVALYTSSNFDPDSGIDRVTITRRHENSGQVTTKTIPLKYLRPAALNRLIEECGFEILQQYGDWDQSPLTPESPEIISLIRKRRC